MQTSSQRNNPQLHSHLHLNRVIRIITLLTLNTHPNPYKNKILVHIVFNIRRILRNPQLPLNRLSNAYRREGARNPVQLLSQRFLVVHIHVRVADHVNELAGLVSRDMR